MTLLKTKWVMKTPRVAMIAAALLAFSAAIAAGQARGAARHEAVPAVYCQVHPDLPFRTGPDETFSGTFYRRADGALSHISESEGPEGVPGTDRYIFIPADRSFAMANSFTGTSTTTLYVEERQFQNLINTEFGTCAILDDESVKRVGESEFLGIKVIEVEDPLGQSSVLRKTIAPELGCFALQKLDIDHGAVRTITQVTQLILGDPDPEAFRPPAGYTEVSPLELNARWRGLYGHDFYFNPAAAQRQEQDYQQRKNVTRRQSDR